MSCTKLKEHQQLLQLLWSWLVFPRNGKNNFTILCWRRERWLQRKFGFVENIQLTLYWQVNMILTLNTLIEALKILKHYRFITFYHRPSSSIWEVYHFSLSEWNAHMLWLGPCIITKLLKVIFDKQINIIQQHLLILHFKILP